MHTATAFVGWRSKPSRKMKMKLISTWNTRTVIRSSCSSRTTSSRAIPRSAPAVWNSLPQTVLSSDSVTVFLNSRLKTLLFSRFPGLSLLPLLTNTLPAPAPRKLRPYGAIQICLLSLLLDATLRHLGSECPFE